MNQKDWPTHWASKGQPWRTEPEIDDILQDYFNSLRSTSHEGDIQRFPFRNKILTRADVEWLLATHEDRGPIDWTDLSQRNRQGLDLRGADLSMTDLRCLPLSGIRFGYAASDRIATTLSKDLPVSRTADLSEAVTADLRRTLLSNAHLEGAALGGVHLERAVLNHTHLEHAMLGGAHLECAQLEGAHLEYANLLMAHLEGAMLSGATLDNASLIGAHFEDAYMYHVSARQALFVQAYLCGADLRASRFEGALFYGAHFEGKEIGHGDSYRVRYRWEQTHLLSHLPPADLRSAVFDDHTQINEDDPKQSSSDTVWGDPLHGFVKLADIVWGGVNLARIDWKSIGVLGDEQEAYLEATPHYTKPLKYRLSEYRAAVRANRQLAIALQAQGMATEASHFLYRAHVVERTLLRRQSNWLQYLFSLFLFLVCGYGYRLSRCMGTYLLIVAFFAILFHTTTGVPFLEAWFTSMNAFHGRGFQPDLYRNNEPGTVIGGTEAFTGLILEAIFIATLLQRFFRK